MRGARWLGGMVASVLLSACGGPPWDGLAWRDSLEMLGTSDDGTVFSARVVAGNTGLLKGQRQLVVDIFPPNGTPLHMQRTIPPWQVLDEEQGRTRLATGRLSLTDDAWSLEVREGAEMLDATFHLHRRAEEAPPVTLVEGERQWVSSIPVPLGSLVGAWRAGAQGGVVRGTGSLARVSGDVGFREPRVFFSATTEDGAVGFHRVGDRAMAWLVQGGATYTGETLTMRSRARKVHFSLEPDLPVEGLLTVRGGSMVTEPWSHLLLPERLASRLLGPWPTRSLERGRVEGTWGGEPMSALGVIWRDPPEPRRRERKGGG